MSEPVDRECSRHHISILVSWICVCIVVHLTRGSGGTLCSDGNSGWGVTNWYQSDLATMSANVHKDCLGHRITKANFWDLSMLCIAKQ